MRHLSFDSCPSDPYVWVILLTKPDGSGYYDYVLLYTDDEPVISENVQYVLRDHFVKYCDLKEDSIGPPEIYLGGRLHKVDLENGVKAWVFGSTQYVRANVDNVW